MKKKWGWSFGWVLVFMVASAASGLDYQWPDYRKPMDTTVKVPLYGGSRLSVDLPAEFITGHPRVLLHMDIESDLFYRIDGFAQRSFEGFVPKVSVNGAIVFGSYRIPVNPLPGRQIVAVKINSDYLKTGGNQLKFYAGQHNHISYRCGRGDNCLCFVIYKLWIEGTR